MLTSYLLLITGFICGVCFLQSQPALPLLWPAICVSLFCFILSQWRFKLAFLILAAFATGFSWANWRAHIRMADRLTPALEQRLIEITGLITDLPQTTRFGTRFLFIPEQTPQTRLPGKIQLQWYGGQPDRVKAGERWHFLVKLKQIHGQSNPGSFDSESWFLQQGTGATGTVKSGERLSGDGAWLHQIRASLRLRILKALPDAPYRGVMIALTVGDQGAIPQEQWQRFAATGITHLISISGLHITLLAAIAAAISSWIWRRIPWLAARFAAQRAALIAGVITAFCYCLLAGMAVPTQRTLFMLAIAAACLWRTQPSSNSAIWAAALLVTVIIDPFAVLSIGFWLSYLSVGALLWAGSNQLGEGAKWKTWISTQAAATLASAPILLVVFGQLPLVSPLANAFAIPIVSILITPLALAGLLDPVGYLLLGAERLFALTDYLLQWCTTMPGPAFNMPGALTLVPAAFGVMLLLLPRGLPARHLGVICCLPLFTNSSDSLQPGQYRASVLDVGQGLAVIVQTAQHQLLFDTGQLPNGERVLLPALRSMQIRQLDALILSHNDQDHIGAAIPLLHKVPTKTIWHSLPDQHPLWLEYPGSRQNCQAGKTWLWDKVRFTLLWPDARFIASSDNAMGCVLRVDNGRHTLLIPADIGIHEEARLIEQGLGKSDILLVPHHGSKSSSSLPFVSQSAPQYAIYSVGYLNRFGHPKAEIVARYRDSQSQNLRTDQTGALIFDVGQEIKVTSWRQAHPHYWSANTIVR
ncbi:DNA internalization-related competence protein ComEC/Rec2 [Iodobacter sp. HSC-16F04]|uniref:DNA internalization-related competence protein ComEC/Rec2 n=1 Tax=Iodobacter violaceini TaxID=3044271 RepID=A0ABX0L5C7_9NEIS|nr:DNA internalization-related competence protein ComEC/Rec2 [Iodobacter violacea]NHQ88681.1 DNA internalization-related competence protein ComEC/Rec2 [Iodobacter violacea]